MTDGAWQLATTWDGHTATALARRCEVPEVELLAETDSTQDVAHALAEDGARSGTVVVADAQRAGRGRLGRNWSSQPGRGVWCTVIERPRDPAALDVLSIRVGLLAAEALDEFADAPIGLKWPNDLMLDARKLGGILSEARWSGTSLGWVAVGVGINVVAPADVEGAIGLREGVERVDVLAGVVTAVRAACATDGHLTAKELARYRKRDALVGREVASPAAGTVVGIAENGALIIETASGPTPFRAGTIRFAEDA